MILQLFVLLVVCGLIWWAAMKLLGAFGFGEPVSTLVQVLLVLVFVFSLLDAFGLVTVGLLPRIR